MRASTVLLWVALNAADLDAQCATAANTPPGTNLTLADEAVRTVALPFPFVFANATYTTVTVASNGYLWLGTGGTSDFWVNEVEARVRAPRIMPLWVDLDPVSLPPAGSGVFWRADAQQVSIVWKDVRVYFTNAFVRVECILSPAGQITFRYDATSSVPTLPGMVGITAGNGALPNPRTWTNDLLGSTPILGATGYQYFPPNTMNLAGRTMTFTPRAFPPGNVDFDVVATTIATCPPGTYPPLASTTTSIVGFGCPAEVRNRAVYQAFTVTGGTTPLDVANTSIEFTRNGDTYAWAAGPGFAPGYAQNGTVLPMTDDQVLRGLTFGPMGSFAFGTQLHTAIAICANGYAWLPDGPVGDFTPKSVELVDRAPRLAPLWMDHDPTAGGTFYWENTDPQFCRATFVAFAERSQPGTANTFQLTLRQNGNIVFAYGAMTGSVANVAVVGISGGAAQDLGPTDLVVAGTPSLGSRRITGAIAPMRHTLDVAPRIGQPFTMASTVPTNNFGLGVFSLGFANPGLPLNLLFGNGTAFGCSLYTDLQWVETVSFPVATTSFALVVAVPYDLNFTGLSLFSQAGALSPQNQAGLLTANGLQFTTGL